MAENFAQTSSDYLTHCERHVLETIIPDKAAFDETTQDLQEILDALVGLRPIED